MSALMLAGCGGQNDDSFAFAPPSAVVEVQREPTPAEREAATRVVVLGTGTPVPDAYRAGSSIAVVHRGRAYLFDAGAGSIRNAVAARYKYDIPSLYPLSICCLFLTHLHSDHTIDYPELAFDLWWRRDRRLEVRGPAGTAEMTTGMLAMMQPDIRLRSGGTQPVNQTGGYRPDAADIVEGTVHESEDLKIEAFAVSHGDIKPAFGYRITAHDRVIVISGDTAYSDRLLEMSRGADLLFHEVISDSGLSRNSEGFQAYHRRSHTPASELGRLASEAKPGLLVLYHGLFYGVPESVIVDEVRANYDGPVVLANDLDIF